MAKQPHDDRHYHKPASRGHIPHSCGPADRRLEWMREQHIVIGLAEIPYGPSKRHAGAEGWHHPLGHFTTDRHTAEQWAITLHTLLRKIDNNAEAA